MGGQARANAVRTANAKRQQHSKTRQAVRPQDAGRGKEMIKRSSEQFGREAAARANASLGSKMIDSSALNAAQAEAEASGSMDEVADTIRSLFSLGDAGPSSADGPRDGIPPRPAAPKNRGQRMDMKTAIQAIKLQLIREQADDFHKPWYIIDPTGDVARKQWRQSREKKRMARSMKALKAADEDGDGAYSISELSQYTQKTRRADRRVSLVGRLAERARRQAHDAAIYWDPRGFTLFPSWDVVSALALLFTAAITPYEVGFLPAAGSASDPLFIVNRLVDLIFIADISFQFFIMFRKQVGTGAPPKQAEERLPPPTTAPANTIHVHPPCLDSLTHVPTYLASALRSSRRAHHLSSGSCGLDPSPEGTCSQPTFSSTWAASSPPSSTSPPSPARPPLTQ